MKLKNQELLALREALTPFQNVHNLKIAWMVAQNLHKVADHVKLIQEILKETPAMEAYEAERKKIAHKYSKKDEKGNPMTRPDPTQPSGYAYDIADMDAFTAELAPVIQANPQAQEDRQMLIQKEIDLMKEEVDFEPYTITLENTKITKDSEESMFDSKTMLMLLHCGILKE
jgi:hypothetical protein